MSHISIPTDSSSLYHYILPKIIRVDDETIHPTDLFNKVKVFINGAWVGSSNDPQKLYIELKQQKYNGTLNIYISIIFDYKLMEIRVCNDGGRLSRPVLCFNLFLIK